MRIFQRIQPLGLLTVGVLHRHLHQIALVQRPLKSLPCTIFHLLEHFNIALVIEVVQVPCDCCLQLSLRGLNLCLLHTAAHCLSIIPDHCGIYSRGWCSHNYLSLYLSCLITVAFIFRGGVL